MFRKISKVIYKVGDKVKYIGADQLVHGKTGKVKNVYGDWMDITILDKGREVDLISTPAKDVEKKIRDGQRAIYWGNDPEFRNCYGKKGTVTDTVGRVDIRIPIGNITRRILNVARKDIELIPDTDMEFLLDLMQDRMQQRESESISFSTEEEIILRKAEIATMSTFIDCLRHAIEE